MVSEVTGRILVFIKSGRRYERKAEEMVLLKLPEPLRMAGDISKHWKVLKEKFDLYLTAITPQDKPLTDASKTALVFILVGDVIEVIINFHIAVIP